MFDFNNKEFHINIRLDKVQYEFIKTISNKYNVSYSKALRLIIDKFIVGGNYENK